MANVLYPKAKQKFLSGLIDLTTVVVKALLVDLADYTYSDAHEFLSDIPAGGRVATSGALASKTVIDGIFDAADSTFPTVTGDQSEALVIYVDTGNPATSSLLAFQDSVTGLPVLPNGGNIVIQWGEAAQKIFAL